MARMSGTAVRDEHPPPPQEQSLDRKGGPGHTLLMALALAIPAVKVAYTVGGGEPARDVFVGMELSNWPDVLIGMLLTEPALGSVFGVVVSRVVFALFASRGSVPKGTGAAQAARRVALTVVNPVAVGIIAACFYGPWWGLGTGVVAYALRQGVVWGYRVEQGASLLLTVVVLPLLAFASAVDGKAWTSVLECQVQEGTRNTSQHLIELGRKGNGVVGWSLDTEEVVNGAGCMDTGSLRVRRAWW
ncbi:hypothetical protein ACIRJS_06705 [Streptomyces sp. NPDC102340]|uniref:hypothetical protein n=1 Tax=unclassified Streptomyces TaxID=2593676 RepID=UPI0037F88110